MVYSNAAYGEEFASLGSSSVQDRTEMTVQKFHQVGIAHTNPASQKGTPSVKKLLDMPLQTPRGSGK